MNESGFEYKWLVELHRELTEGNTQVLYLYGETPKSIAETIVDADDCYGEYGTVERMAKCWTPDPFRANRYDEDGARQTAAALDRCCGGIAIAAEHGYTVEDKEASE